MTSQRKRSANSANSRKSTGPRTARGKAISALNAVSHGLSGRPIYDELSQQRIEALALTFAGDASGESTVNELARKAAEAQVMVDRVRQARCHAWESAAKDDTIRTRDSLRAYGVNPDPMDVAAELGLQLSLLKKVMPTLFQEPFYSQFERDIAVIDIATSKLVKLNCYERRAINHCDKTFRSLEERKR